MGEKTAKEVARRHPKPPLMEVCEANDIIGGAVWFILVAGDNPLRPCGIRHWTEEPILDESQGNLLAEARMAPRIH
jgi:hypothetical protein